MDNTDEMDYESIASLLEGPAWVQYRTRVDLLGQPEGDPQVQAARKAMLSDPQVQRLAAEVAHWPGPILKSHNEAVYARIDLDRVEGMGVWPEEGALAVDHFDRPAVIEAIRQPVKSARSGGAGLRWLHYATKCGKLL